ncbi:hypothetical protein SAICODRAFT_29494 [Saitoella complicata NRRL Y-17804]|uniref:Uncharacterized protein n=1 Tax=Saitoella complicata (strain BCRC 22490 / CBS 7301 / JCM 7358 / NBRC 10748 / NRRL Y-17804) TaxID=698492 RepID=A0A0E9N8S1_SAICN|nr:uncharacterized protein SAICODRAFT_29494 [Saitoella complicata NRRL Y-17804]ODQ54337.1 hypothetical protein SAICODRAFT_29494 [Saitoella complicata NRRL Y-17804]GAO45795.1 hypothetical protein G7K_0046-t1 [Saitoella complicata NRRL Y-17804]
MSNKNISEALGQYLLQGYTMLNTVHDCGAGVPLMRSRAGEVICVRCINNIPSKDAEVAENQVDEIESDIDEDTAADEPEQASTSAPTDSKARQEQSSRASSLIGEKLLQGWAMLNSVCSNDTCYGVPLLRNPKDRREYCVICERAYVDGEEVPPSPTLVDHEKESANARRVPVEESSNQSDSRAADTVITSIAPATLDDHEMSTAVSAVPDTTTPRTTHTNTSTATAVDDAIQAITALLEHDTKVLRPTTDHATIVEACQRMESLAGALEALARVKTML